MKIKKYEVSNIILKRFIKYYWVLNSGNQCIDHKLLPVCNSDLVLNLSSPIKYYSENEETFYGFHLNTIKTKHFRIKQSGNIEVIGISFKAYGLYPFIKIPLYEFTGSNIDLSMINNVLVFELTQKLHNANSVLERIKIIEDSLLKLLDTKFLSNHLTFDFFERFMIEINNNTGINEFCDRYGIHIRRMERSFKTFVGVSPKTFTKIYRFNRSLRQILHKEYSTLAEIALDNNYFDQMHFIKEFKSFTGNSPSEFIQQNNTVKQILI